MDKTQVLRKIIEKDDPALFEYAYKVKLIDNSVIQNSLEIFQKPESLLPQNGDVKALAISKSSRDYFFFKTKELGIKNKNEIAKSFGEIIFQKGERYPICSLVGDAPAFKRMKDTTPITSIPDCSKVDTQSLIYFEIFDISRDWLSLVMITDKVHGQQNELILGSKIYVKPHLIASPYYFKSEDQIVPIGLAGLTEIKVHKNSYEVLGSENICKGTDSPKLTKDTKILTNHFPTEFNPNNFNVVSSLKRKIKVVCQQP